MRGKREERTDLADSFAALDASNARDSGTVYSSIVRARTTLL
jgi:hypothetical protein